MPFDDQEVLRRIEMLRKRLGVEWRLQAHVPGREVRGNYLFRDDMLIEAFQLDYEHLGHDRGGILEGIGRQDYQRTAACFAPIEMMVIGYSGTVLPCCHFVGDAEQHQGLVVGRLGSGTSLFEIYASPAALEWRKSLFGISPKGKECQNCVDHADDLSMHSAGIMAATARPGKARGIELFGGGSSGRPLEGVFRVA
jgi:hypothetical protein